tara:strand:- start:228 stop:533 length:306 start_codon:yes stop_codon:yes gene_type:complete
MVIVEYVYDPVTRERPSWVVEGAHWCNQDDDEKVIGVAKEETVPDGVTVLTLEELQARQRAIHAKYPMEKNLPPIPSDDPRIRLTDDEINAAIKEWVDART